MFFFHFLNVNICFLVFAERHVLASRLKSITTDKHPARWPCSRQRYPSKCAEQLAVGSEATRWPWGWFLPKTPARSTASAVHSTASRLPWISESCTFSLKNNLLGWLECNWSASRCERRLKNQTAKGTLMPGTFCATAPCWQSNDNNHPSKCHWRSLRKL